MKNKWMLFILSILLIVFAAMIEPISNMLSDLFLGIAFVILISFLYKGINRRKKNKNKKGIF